MSARSASTPVENGAVSDCGRTTKGRYAPITFHIGFPKTASTTLQRFLLDRAVGVHAILRPDDRRREEPEKIAAIKAIMNADDTVFDDALPRIRAGLARAQGAGTPVILSHEALSVGAVLSRHFQKNADRAIIACRLHAIAPDARIVAVVREQRDLVPSLYAELRYSGGTTKPFDRWLNEDINEDYPQSILKHFCYDQIIEMYHSLFGADNVQILRFEELREDPENFARCIAAASGIDEAALTSYFRTEAKNASGARSKLQLSGGTLLSLRDKVTHADWRGLVRAVAVRTKRLAQSDTKPTLTPTMADKVATEFTETNMRLAAMTGLDLRAPSSTGAGTRTL